MTSLVLTNDAKSELNSAQITETDDNGNERSLINFNLNIGSHNEKWYSDMMQEPFVYSTFIWPYESQGGSPAAAAVVIRCTPKLAYVSLAASTHELLSCRVKLRPTAVKGRGSDNGLSRHAVYQISGVVDGLRELELDALWQTHIIRDEQPALEHAVGRTVQQTLGLHNLEKEKSATCLAKKHATLQVDLIDYNYLDEATRALWRDRLGFLVSDSRHLVELNVHRVGDLVDKILGGSPVPQYIIRPSSSPDGTLVAYDKSVAGVDRTPYLSALCRAQGIHVLQCTAADGELVCGETFYRRGALLALYAESRHAVGSGLAPGVRGIVGIIYPATAQLLYVLQQMRRDESITINCVKGTLLHSLITDNNNNDNNCTVEHSVREVRRCHTVAVPHCIEWHRVYAFNRGMHLV